jgi:hypothetical protein
LGYAALVGSKECDHTVIEETNITGSMLWLAMFGIFSNIYLHRGLGEKERYQGTDTKRMQYAAWIDLTNVLLWFLSAIGGIVAFFAIRKQRSLHTGSSFLNI